MKKQINRLVELAEMYAKKCIELHFPDTHNYLQDKKEDQIEMRVYLADGGRVWVCYFDKVWVVGYKKSIELPFTVDVKYLNTLIEKVEQFYDSYLWGDKEVENNEYKLKRIAELEKQIETLKNS